MIPSWPYACLRHTMKITATTLITIACLHGVVNGGGILAIFPFPVKSHYNVHDPLLKRLSVKGHRIVVVTQFPQTTSPSQLYRRGRHVHYTELERHCTFQPSILQSGLVKHQWGNLMLCGVNRSRVSIEPSGSEENYRDRGKASTYFWSRFIRVYLSKYMPYNRRHQ